ncbi:hypothetical protein M0R45_035531 [Rubus argutus]|uniref:Uncharacterized protein n=1 Tax=Rubus argutus TaxID=59490 RepID=A0AAW1VYT6_RUBAR
MVEFLLCIYLIEIYEDDDNARKDEIAALGDQTATGTNVFSAFYDRLKRKFYCVYSGWFRRFGRTCYGLNRFIREYHRRHPAALVLMPMTDMKHCLRRSLKSSSVERKLMDDTWIYMNCTIRISILNLKSPLSTLLTLMFFHNHIRFLRSPVSGIFLPPNMRTESLQDLDRIFVKHCKGGQEAGYGPKTPTVEVGGRGESVDELTLPSK